MIFEILFKIYLGSAFLFLVSFFVGISYSTRLFIKRYPELAKTRSFKTPLWTFLEVVGLAFCPVVNTVMGVTMTLFFTAIVERAVLKIKMEVISEIREREASQTDKE